MGFRLEVEQVHLLADLAVVALGSFLEPDEMLVELLLAEPGRPINSRQHRVPGIAAPISTRHPGQLERIGVELAGRGEVGAAAQIDPGAVALAGAVHGDRFALGQLHHPFGLERLATLDEEITHLVASPHLAHQRAVGGDDSPHLLLDRREVLLGEWAMLGGGREVVIEAVVRRRAEGDLGSWKEVLHRLGEDVRIIVTDQLERFALVARSDQCELRVALERPHDVADLAVDLRRQGGAGKPGTDRRGDVRRGRALGHLLHRPVGKSDLEHPGHRFGM